MIKEIKDKSHIKDVLIEQAIQSTMVMARNQSLICYDNINFVLVKESNIKTAFKIFSYWVSPYHEKTMSYSLFLSEDEEFLVYRIDEYDRIGLAECVMQKQEINDFKIVSRVILIEGKECKEVLKNFYKIEESSNCNLTIEELNREIFGERLFLNFSNYKKSLEFSDPYGCKKLTKVVSDFISLLNTMTQNSDTENEMFLEFGR